MTYPAAGTDGQKKGTVAEAFDESFGEVLAIRLAAPHFSQEDLKAHLESLYAVLGELETHPLLRFLEVDIGFHMLITRASGNGRLIHSLTQLALAAFLCWVGWSRRTQHLLVVELQEVQAQLRAQMARAEQLAAMRERARIARDMHDVLAHTLTMLSIQVQAARQLVHQQPEHLSAKLDDIAELLRESIAESRRVVGLLRETAIVTAPQGEVGARLQTVIDRFSERTGIHCVFVEKGTPYPISDAQAETLQYALQEALTNAHRHGAAQHVWAELRCILLFVLLLRHPVL